MRFLCFFLGVGGLGILTVFVKKAFPKARGSPRMPCYGLMMERKPIGSGLYLYGWRSWGANACDGNSWEFQVHLPCGKGWYVGSKLWRNYFSAPADCQVRKWAHYCHAL